MKTTNLIRRLRLVLLAAAAVLVSGQTSKAIVIFDNFDPGGGFHPQFNLTAAGIQVFFGSTNGTRAAAQFTVTGGDFALGSITLPISVGNNVPGNFLRVRLASDVAGAPGPTLEILSENQGIWPSISNPFTNVTTVPSLTHPLLYAGQKYWIVTEPTSIPPGAFVAVDYRWFINTNGSSVLVRQEGEPGIPSDPWSGSSFSNNAAFRVEGVNAYCRLVDSGETWRYFAALTNCCLPTNSAQADAREVIAFNLETGWMAPDYDDTAWPAGPSRLGFGGGEATVVGNPTNNIITYYFRHHFRTTYPAGVTNLEFRVQRDDGVVAYLNGAEIYRNNMPTGAVNWLMPAELPAPDNGLTWLATNVSPGLLVAGDNVLAIEIHQATNDFNDMGMDAILLARPGCSPPVIVSPPVGGNFPVLTNTTLCVAATGTPPLWYQWRVDGRELPGATNACLSLTNLHSSDGGDYAVEVFGPCESVTSSVATVTVSLPGALSASMQGTTLQVLGTTGPDYLVFSVSCSPPQAILIDDRANGVGTDFTFPLAGITRLEVDLGDGDDRFVWDDTCGALETLPIDVLVDGGDGNDILQGSTTGVNEAALTNTVQLLSLADCAGTLASNLICMACSTMVKPSVAMLRSAQSNFIGLATAYTDQVMTNTLPLTSNLVDQASSLTNAAQALGDRASTNLAQNASNLVTTTTFDPASLQTAISNLNYFTTNVPCAGPFTPGDQSALDGLEGQDTTAANAAAAAGDQIEQDTTSSVETTANQILGDGDTLDQTGQTFENNDAAAVDSGANSLGDSANNDFDAASTNLDNQADQLMNAATNLQNAAQMLVDCAEQLAAQIVTNPPPGLRPSPNMIPSNCNCNMSTRRTFRSRRGNPFVAIRVGTGGNDELYGRAMFNFLFGRDGDDRMTVESPALLPCLLSVMDGGAGNDCMKSEALLDIMIGGDGDDQMEGRGERNLHVMIGGKGQDCMTGGNESLFDIMFGNDGDDTITGRGGMELVFGGAGDDSINAGSGRVLVDTEHFSFEFGGLYFGNDGKDVIFGGTGMDLEFGGDGDDTLVGGAGMDLMFGNNGNDNLDGGVGASLYHETKSALGLTVTLLDIRFGNIIFGNDGDDIIKGGTDSDLLFGGKGDDQIDAGGDRFDLLHVPPLFSFDLLFGNDGNDKLTSQQGIDLCFGGHGNDEITDTGGPVNLLFGNDDNDKLTAADGLINLVFGGNGDDEVNGGSAFIDLLFGNAGNDKLYGNAGIDIIFGNDGNDELYGGSGLIDLLFCGKGDDLADGGPGINLMFGNDGNDTLLGGSSLDLAFGGKGDDIIHGNGGLDLLFGNDGNDCIYGEDGIGLIFGGKGRDTLFGGNDFDLIFGNDDNDWIHGGDGLNLLFGNAGDDHIFGGNNADFIFGGPGNDRIEGGNGLNFLFGNDDNDRLEGGADTDFMFGGAGDDVMVGGGGPDLMFGGVGNDIIDGGDGDDFVFGGPGNNTIYGGQGNDWLFGDAGNDVIFGEEGNDLILGGDGNDRLSGGPGDDIMDGGNGDDDLLGGPGQDVVIGGDGVDRLDGGEDADRLFGGGGNDQIYGVASVDDCPFDATGTDVVSAAPSGLVFPDVQIAEIHGVKWSDTNGDGIHDSNEPGLAGVRIYLDLDNDGQYDLGEPTMLTLPAGTNTCCDEPAGRYWFTNLAKGTYHVREVPPVGYFQTFPDDPTTDAWVEELRPTSEVRGRDFGNALCSLIPLHAISLSCTPSNYMLLKFNKPLDPSCALNLGHYSANHGLSVVQLLPGPTARSVIVGLCSCLQSNQSYALSISNVCDGCNLTYTGSLNFSCPNHVAVPGPITISRSGGNIVLQWSGIAVLLQANEVTGPWTVVGCAAGSYSVPASSARRFYRLSYCQ